MATDASSSTTKIPDKYLGTFKLDRSENFDEFLQAKGVNWLLRKMIGASSVTKIFKRSQVSADAYDLDNLSFKKNLHYQNWKLNEPFESEGFDGQTHKITFSYDPTADVLSEKHYRVGNSEDIGETYTYTIHDNELVLTMKNKQLTCKRYFKKQ